MKISIKMISLLLPAFLLAVTMSAQVNGGDQEELSVVKTFQDTDLQWGPCPSFMPEGCGIAVLHGDPAKKNSDIFLKVEPNSEIANHWHTSAERMVLISGEMEVTYEGEETVALKAGSYAYGPARKPHWAKCGDAGPCVLFIAFEEPVDAIPKE